MVNDGMSWWTRYLDSAHATACVNKIGWLVTVCEESCGMKLRQGLVTFLNHNARFELRTVQDRQD